MADPRFNAFQYEVLPADIPEHLNDPFEVSVHELCATAADELKSYLLSNSDIEHNFGMGEKSDLLPHGKMFGVLVVENAAGEIGYLVGYSGKLLGENNLSRFVPVVGKTDRDESFINAGMRELSEIGSEIQDISSNPNSDPEVKRLKALRKSKSQALQRKIFEAYYFSNAKGEQKTLLDIFEKGLGIQPPSGAGECAAPKLLQYAFDHKMKPLAIAEFWWGKPRKGMDKEHGQFYPACEDKCRPILNFMMQGL